MSPALTRITQNILIKYPHLTEENVYRTLLLYHGLNFESQTSYPDHFTHYEIFYTPSSLTTFPVLTFLKPDSPFRLISNDRLGNSHTLVYEDEYVDTIHDYEQRFFDFRKPEPFYFYVKEVNGDLVLKLNPIQLCDFFQNTRGMLPCSFCFRNDMVQRFQNLTAQELVDNIWSEEQKNDNLATLKGIDEISIVTGSYTSDDEYLEAIHTLVTGIKPKIDPHLRVVVGSHEGKGLSTYHALKSSGVTVFAFPIESLSDDVRKTQMRNRKGTVPMTDIIANVASAVDVFGADGVIIRLVAGMGDRLDDSFIETVQTLSNIGRTGQSPLWNINQYMPFTHYHWRLFQNKPPFDLDYLLHYSDIINQFVPQERQIRFKVSP